MNYFIFYNKQDLENYLWHLLFHNKRI